MKKRHSERDVVCANKALSLSHANEEFKAIVLDYDLPVVTTNDMDQILSFLMSLVDLRTIKPDMPRAEEIVVDLEQRRHSANLCELFDIVEEV
eukprot:884879-Prorocentrum_lima.AAC.1